MAFYHEYGYHIEHNVFTPAECDIVIEAAYELEEAKKGVFRPCMMPHRQHPIFLQALQKSKIVALIAAAVGGKPAGIQTEFFYCKPGTRGFSLHQDNFYVEAEYGVFASAWSPLVDTTQQNGGLIIYPGSHKEGGLPTRKLNLNADAGQDPNANNEETVVPEKYHAVSVSIPQGAALLIHGHLVHGSNSNQSDQARHVLLSTYIKSGSAFRAGNHAKRAEVELIPQEYIEKIALPA